MARTGTAGMMMALAMIATSAAAQQPELTGTAPAPAKEKKTCRRLTPTGSFMATRVCNTKAGWAAFDGSNAAGVNDFRRALNMSSTNERASPQ